MYAIQSIDLISIDPNVRGGRPCIAGSGLRVIDIVIASIFHDRTPGQIAADFKIELAQVHAGLAYYYQHQDELDADIREQIITMREAKAEYRANIPSSLLP